MGVWHSFSAKNIFYDKMDLELFYFDEVIWVRFFKLLGFLSLTLDTRDLFKHLLLIVRFLE